MVRVGTTPLVRNAFLQMSPDGQARVFPSTPELGTLEINEQLAALDRENWRLREENAALRAGRDNPANPSSATLTQKNQEIERLQVQLEKAQETISMSTQELKEVQAARTAVTENEEERMRELEKKLSFLETALEEVRTDKKDVEGRLNLSQARITELESRESSAPDTHGERAYIEELESKLPGLEDDLEKLKSRKTELEDQLRLAQNTIEELQSRVEKSSSLTSQARQDESDKWKSRALDAEFELTELTAELKAAKKQVYSYSRGPMMLYGRIKECLAEASLHRAEEAEKRAFEAEKKATDAARRAQEAEAEAEEAIATYSQEVRDARRSSGDQIKAAEAKSSMQISAAESEVREMRHRMETALKSAEAARKVSEQAQSSAQSASQEREEAVRASTEARARKDEAEISAKAAIREKDAAVAAQVEAESASHRLRLAAESADRRRESAEAALRENEAVVRRLKADLVSAQTANTTIDRTSRERLANAQSEVEKLNDQLEAAQEALRASQGDFGLAQRRISELESTLQATRNDLNAAREQAQAQSTVATQLSRSLEVAQRLASNSENAEKELKSLRLEYQQIAEETEALRHTTADQAVRLRSSPQQLGKLQDELLQLRQQAQSATSELAELKGKENQRFTKYKEALEAEAQSVVGHYERMYSADRELLQRQAADLESRLQDTERRLVEARGELVEVRGAGSRAESQLRELQIEIASLRQALAVAEGGATRLRTEAEGFANMEKQLAAAQHELATYESTAREEVSRRDSELMAKSALLEKANSEIESLRHRLKQAEVQAHDALNRVDHVQEIETDKSKLMSRVELLRRAAQVTRRYLTAVCSLQSRQIARLQLAKEWASEELRSRELRQLEMMRRAQVPPPSRPTSLAAVFNAVLAAVRFTRPTAPPEDLALHKVYEHLDKDYLL